MLIEIISSHGLFWAEPNGVVKEVSLDAEFGAMPVYVNWPEWMKTYPGESLPDAVDVLDVGFIDATGTYEPPCDDWRGDRAEMRATAIDNDAKLARFIELCNDAAVISVFDGRKILDWELDTEPQSDWVLSYSYTNEEGDVVEEYIRRIDVIKGRFTENGFACNNSDSEPTTLRFFRTTNMLSGASC